MHTLTELSRHAALSTPAAFQAALDHAECFTQAFCDLDGIDIAEREAQLLGLQFSTQFLPLEPADSLAGRVRYPLVGFSPQPMGMGFYCDFVGLTEGMEAYPDEAGRAQALVEFWRQRTTEAHCRAALPPVVAKHLPSDAWFTESGVGFPLYRIGGSTLDYGKLVELGLDGLEQVTAPTVFAHIVSLLRATIDNYLAGDPPEAVRQSLQAIRHAPPASYRDAVQLIWLYALHAGSWNYGRLDIVLGPLLARDLEEHALTWQEARELTCGWWRLMETAACQYDHRVIVGGMGRPDEAAADRFALLAIAATRANRSNHPQLTLRFYEGQDPVLWERAIDAIGEGCTFPMLYNDDVNVPAVKKAFGVSEDLALDYTPFGCGEYVLGHHGVGSPNGVINLLKGLEVALHGGVDPVTGYRVANVPPVASMQSFDELWRAYRQVVEPIVTALAEHQATAYRVAAQEAPYGLISALISGCVERNRSAIDGGSFYLGGSLETYGNTNTADSLHVIEELVFKRGEVSLGDLVAALDSNFEGAPELRARCQAIAKYGNDEALADAMAQRVHDHICNYTKAQARPAGLDSYLVVVINNWANTVLGRTTQASAEGRLAGDPLANGNNPTSGADRNGVTAFMNSLVQLDPAIHAGTVQNMKFTSDWFGAMRPKFDALLRSYFAAGGTQAMISVVSRKDLEAALREPEKWGHLIIRVGGFSIRFIDLPPDAQAEFLARTFN